MCDATRLWVHSHFFLVSTLLSVVCNHLQAGERRTTWVGVRVVDENDWAPEWEHLTYQGITTSTADPHYPVLAAHTHHTHTPTPLTVTARDRDEGRNGRVTYTIVENHMKKYFAVDQYTGESDFLCVCALIDHYTSE